MKHIALVTAVLAAAGGAAYAAYPGDLERYAARVADLAVRLWAGVEANPVPVSLALGTFLVTVAYHRAKGKTLRESVEVAATRVAVVPVPYREFEDDGDENPVLRRAKARATRTQLLADQIGLQNRQRKLPEVVVKAEQDVCYTEQALADAERALADRKKAHDDAVARLDALREEKAAGEAELAAIEAELKKLAELV